MKADDVASHVGEEWCVKFTAGLHGRTSTRRCRIEGVELWPEAQWKNAARKVRMAKVTWLDETSGDPITVRDEHRAHVRPSSIEVRWIDHVAERTRASQIRAGNEAAKAALLAGLRGIGIDARVTTPWRDHHSTLEVELSADQANALATAVAQLGGD